MKNTKTTGTMILNDEVVKALTDAAKTIHWGVMNFGLALGLKAGLCGMRQLGLNRKEPTKVEACGSFCFAQGVEIMTGCSLVRGTMKYKHRPISETLKIYDKKRAVILTIKKNIGDDFEEIFKLTDGQLFEIKLINL
jgi:formylmethanofuran dehydrogenase subunit E